jgi:hypothetical protein
MADPSTAIAGFALHYLVYGHIWTPRVVDDGGGEIDLLTDAPTIGAPLFLMWTGEGRTINGSAESFGSAGLERIDQSSGGLDGSRWVRVVNRPATGTSIDEPIRQKAHGVCEVSPPNMPWFEVSGWEDGLTGGSFGGSRVSITVYDPGELYGGIFVEGRSVAIYVEEYESTGGAYSLVSATELFSGFVLPGAEQDDVNFHPIYSFSAGTINDLLSIDGLDGDRQTFMSTDFEAESEIVGEEPMDTEETPLILSDPQHVMGTLNVATVAAHMFQNHLWVEIDSDLYRLAAVCDMRTDWNNLDSDDEYALDLVQLPAGNIISAIAGLLNEPSPIIAYSGPVSQLTITPDHEFKSTPDSVIDSVSTTTVYRVRTITGQAHPVSAVVLEQSPIGQKTIDEPSIVTVYPVPADTQGSVKRYSIPAVFSTAGGAERLAQGTYARANAERTQILVSTRGAAFGLHNRLTWQGDDYSAIRVSHSPVSTDDLAPHTTAVLARRLG